MLSELSLASLSAAVSMHGARMRNEQQNEREINWKENKKHSLRDHLLLLILLQLPLTSSSVWYMNPLIRTSYTNRFVVAGCSTSQRSKLVRARHQEHYFKKINREQISNTTDANGKKWLWQRRWIACKIVCLLSAFASFCAWIKRSKKK